MMRIMAMTKTINIDESNEPADMNMMKIKMEMFTYNNIMSMMNMIK